MYKFMETGKFCTKAHIPLDPFREGNDSKSIAVKLDLA